MAMVTVNVHRTAFIIVVRKISMRCMRLYKISRSPTATIEKYDQALQSRLQFVMMVLTGLKS